ncbi:Cytochrome c biogenesis protein TlpA [Tritonibacter multivorans]|uniref:Cytochrome c biogenesis protein TlpA n=1 Tax=Tritonibacter multivorans TaxID=928856 RepID=A0A0P1GII5_9RHOB|nr:TlpA disulfide reductase family protein [Tritonibacter multivorans]MDA7419699.1 TlpA disulfide reductase family protein [Tritonibacter multivorans]CUH76004.1 Cytochrome c biogenesis protein TlpA [Tritonibacter multivorans]SFC57196.1 Thiol-disulfide isomerase or thioredoxin [Tritonibacter multivorans]
MRLFRLIPLYMAMALGANILAPAVLSTVHLGAAHAEEVALADLREGDMRKLIFHPTPMAASEKSFQLADKAGSGSLADYRGKVVLLNFWATWCAPCRKEMPMLSALQKEFGGEDFEVLTLATGRNTPGGIAKFFDENGLTDLPRHQDGKGLLAKDMKVFGLPTTVILDREGQEIARLRGDADWYSDSARAIVAALVAKD